jgi:hypothetical protein
MTLKLYLDQEIIKPIGINTTNMDNIILYESGVTYYYKSTTAIEIAKNVRPFSLGKVF